MLECDACVPEMHYAVESSTMKCSAYEENVF